MLRLNTLFCFVLLALTACIESPPPASQPINTADMAPDLEDDSGTEGDQSEDGCVDDGECSGVCEDGECIECRVGEEGGCATGVCSEGATAAENSCVECVISQDCPGGVCFENSCVACVENEDCGSDRLSCVNNACTGCASDIELCTGNSPHCKITAELPSGECVECLEDGNCAGNNVCDPASNQCVTCLPRVAQENGEEVKTGCTDEEVCLEDLGDSNLNRCVECTSNQDCGEGVCHLESNTCVTCVISDDCPQGRVCTGEQRVEERQCVACIENDDCPGGVCDVDENDPANSVCVQCLGNDDCANSVGKRCDLDSNICTVCLNDNDCGDAVCIVGVSADLNQCKECRNNGQCTSPSASFCDSSNECSACANDGDCAHLTGLGQCVAGTCRQCDVATESTDCSGNVCDPSTNTCTTVQLQSAALRKPCSFDSQCVAGSTCVPLNFVGSFHGNYCMPFTPNSVPCPRPYGSLGSNQQRTSVDGATVTVCMINESLTTPEAIEGYMEPCTQDSNCVGEGAICRPTILTDISQEYCTYGCASDRDCRSTAECRADLAQDFCVPE